MNCHNCGAAMHLFERRRYYFCRHCGSFHFIEIAEADGIRVLQRSADAVPCGVCQAPLAKALLDDHHTVHYCEKCRGVLLPRREFAEVVGRRRAWATTPPVTPQPLDRSELHRSVTCPLCRKRLLTHPYYGPGAIVIDSCDTCDVVWLDFGELKQVGDAPGADRGRRTPPRPASRDSVARAIARESADPVIESLPLLGVLIDLMT